MAGGKNAAFRRNPAGFMAAHTYMLNPQAATPATQLGTGQVDLDLVPVVGPANPAVVRLEVFGARTHGLGARALSTYFLPAINDDTNTIQIAAARPYFFTADLSGCLFAAYGANAQGLTVEHVNARTPAAQVPIVQRGNQIIAANHAYCFIITPVPLGAAGGATVVNYLTGGNVVGVLENGSWVFYYRLDQNPVGHS